MANCNACGSSIPDGLAACPSCGAALNTGVPGQDQPFQPADGFQQPQNFQQPGVAQPMADYGSIGWGFLGFLIPLVGLILYLVWRNTKPKTAKVAGTGAIVGVVFGIFTNLLLMLLSGGAAS